MFRSALQELAPGSRKTRDFLLALMLANYLTCRQSSDRLGVHERQTLYDRRSRSEYRSFTPNAPLLDHKWQSRRAKAARGR